MSYNPNSVQSSPVRVREFLHWLEQQHIPLKHINEQTITTYFSHLSRRSNQRRTGALSNDYLNMHRTSLKQFSHYLQQSRQEGFTITQDYHPSAIRDQILTPEQIKALYEATGTNTTQALRNRAILALYYGCGLRRNEGVHVNVSEDVWLDRKLLYVRKGKLYRERYVPLARHVQEDIGNYLTIARCSYLQDDNPALILSRLGNRMSGNTILQTVQALGRKANIPIDFGLHTLRHSIATHLLHAGMPLEQIARFLGHKSLKSTQIYTHIAAQLSP